MKAIFVLMDSVNRHLLEAYEPSCGVKTPCLTKFAKDCVRFDNHWAASTPCMPARRDLFTGRTNFLERSWGGIEPFDRTLQQVMRENHIFTHMVTDHYHYFELGGEGYCQQFDTWQFLRGQESDPWVSCVKPPEIPPHYGRTRAQYERNRTRFRAEADYPTPQTFASACDWLVENKDADDFFLMVEAFDPHEPFDCPQKYLELYADDYKGPRYDWPEYQPVQEPPDAQQHIRKQYAAALTMADAWFGRLMETLRSLGLYEDTMIVFTTDHGHLLGEHGFMAKNYMHQYNELVHIPLLIHLPRSKYAGMTIKALTQTTDLMPTLLDAFELPVPPCVTGKSLSPLWTGEKASVRDYALYGFFGKAVNITDGHLTYLRAPAAPDNQPLAQYTAMPTGFRSYLGTKNACEITAGRFLSYTEYPVFRIPQKATNLQYVSDTLLFDLEQDPAQQHPVENSEKQEKMKGLLRQALREEGAPAEQFVRLGL